MKEELENNKATLGKTTRDIAKVMAVGQCLALTETTKWQGKQCLAVKNHMNWLRITDTTKLFYTKLVNKCNTTNNIWPLQLKARVFYRNNLLVYTFMSMGLLV